MFFAGRKEKLSACHFTIRTDYTFLLYVKLYSHYITYKTKIKTLVFLRLHNSMAVGSYCLNLCLLVTKRTTKKQMSQFNYLVHKMQNGRAA
jgi:hypothetical protein